MNRALKDKNFVFFGQHIRTDAEMIQSVLADQNSACLQDILRTLQDTCAVGDRGACLQPGEWTLYGGNFMANPQKIQKCITSLISTSYVLATGDDCVKTQVANWLAASSVSSSRNCVLTASLDIQEFSMYARHLVPGLPNQEALFPNHCTNATVDMYLSVYGAMTVFLTLKNSADATKPRWVTRTICIFILAVSQQHASCVCSNLSCAWRCLTARRFLFPAPLKHAALSAGAIPTRGEWSQRTFRAPSSWTSGKGRDSILPPPGRSWTLSTLPIQTQSNAGTWQGG